jgi:FMN reductase
MRQRHMDSRKPSFRRVRPLLMIEVMVPQPLLDVVSLSGSPSADSRSAALLHFIERRVSTRASRVRHISLRELPAADLLQARSNSTAIRAAVSAVDEANLVMVATPIYKAAYSGLLKVFLDLLPPDALRGKTVLPLATGGSPGHLLALEYALKPVLAALGARHVLDPVYVVDSAWNAHEQHGRVPTPDVIARIDEALRGLQPQATRRSAEAIPG